MEICIPNNKISLRIVDIVYVVLFVLSLTTELALVICSVLVPLVLLILEENIGVAIIRSFIFFALRTPINTGIGASFNSTSSTIKWMVIMVESVATLILFCKNNNWKKICIVFTIYSIYLAIGSLMISSYPTTSLFKNIAYIVPFLAVTLIISNNPFCDWVKLVRNMLYALLIISIPLIQSGIGYLRNGHGFQGVFNHPNMLGIMVALFAASYFCGKSRIGLIEILTGLVCITEVYLSESRTGLFSVVAILILFVITSELTPQKKTVAIVMLIIIVFAIIKYQGEKILTFIYKGNDDILYSRENQIERNISRLKAHPLLGTGFMVPYSEGVRDYALSMELMVENGNIVLSLLGDTGILGLMTFIAVYGYVFMKGNKKYILLFIVPFMISMGEMGFFSTNNYALILYLFFAIYLFQNGGIQG